MRALDEVAEHRLGDLEVGDHAVLDRAHRADAARRAAEHLLRLVTDREHALAAPLVVVLRDRDDARLRADHPLAARVDEGVGGPEVDREVAGERSGELVEDHARLRFGERVRPEGVPLMLSAGAPAAVEANGRPRAAAFRPPACRASRHRAASRPGSGARNGAGSASAASARGPARGPALVGAEERHRGPRARWLERLLQRLGRSGPVTAFRCASSAPSTGPAPPSERARPWVATRRASRSAALLAPARASRRRRRRARPRARRGRARSAGSRCSSPGPERPPPGV